MIYIYITTEIKHWKKKGKSQLFIIKKITSYLFFHWFQSLGVGGRIHNCTILILYINKYYVSCIHLWVRRQCPPCMRRNEIAQNCSVRNSEFHSVVGLLFSISCVAVDCCAGKMSFWSILIFSPQFRVELKERNLNTWIYEEYYWECNIENQRLNGWLNLSSCS